MVQDKVPFVPIASAYQLIFTLPTLEKKKKKKKRRRRGNKTLRETKLSFPKHASTFGLKESDRNLFINWLTRYESIDQIIKKKWASEQKRDGYLKSTCRSTLSVPQWTFKRTGFRSPDSFFIKKKMRFRTIESERAKVFNWGDWPEWGWHSGESRIWRRGEMEKRTNWYIMSSRPPPPETLFSSLFLLAFTFLSSAHFIHSLPPLLSHFFHHPPPFTLTYP